MSKTITQSLKDDTIYPIPIGKIENIVIRRFGSIELGELEFTRETDSTAEYKGALADCLASLLQAINFSEAGMSVGVLTDAQRKAILKKANALYKEIGEEEIADSESPTVFINC